MVGNDRNKDMKTDISGMNSQNIKQRLGQNWRSGFTVSLISIPLSIALAIASGATPTQGIITAFWAGLAGSILGGSHFNIIGPTGALSGVLVSFAFTYGYEALPVIAIESGILTFISYLFRYDRYIIFIPRSVIHGFTLGIAILIGFGQIDFALGLHNITKTDHFVTSLAEVFKHLGEAKGGIFLLYCASVLFILFWNRKIKKLPGAILAALFSVIFVLLNHTLGWNLDVFTLQVKYPEIQNALFLPSAEFSALWLDKNVIFISLTTSIIAQLETLLSGQIADQKTSTRFDRPREVLALAVANVASGVMGGIPSTAALARTALNIESGANHRASGILHAFFVGVISLFFMDYFVLMPMVMIAAILTVVAINMVEKNHFIRLIENERTAFVLSMIVMALVVFEDPMIGILAGTVLALLIFVSKVSYGQTEIQVWKTGKLQEVLLKNDFLQKAEIDSDMIIYEISGTLTYINMPAHLAVLEKVKGNESVIISLQHAFYADTDGVEYLAEIVMELKKHNKNVILAGINREVQKQIQNEKFYRNKLVNGKIYTTATEAIGAAKS